VLTGLLDVGSGAHTMLRQVVAEVLTIDPDDVLVEVGDTATALFDSGSGAQRVTRVHGTATYRAAQKLREALCNLAPDLMRWPGGVVRLERGQLVAEASGRSVAFRDLAARAARLSGGRFAVQEAVAVDTEGEQRTFTAQVVEVEVDPETGQVRLRRVVSVQDGGFILNPLIAEGHAHGAAITGMGYALMEGLEVEEGRIGTANLGEYKIPCAQDVPEFRTLFLDSEEGPSPYGSKAVGEITISPLPPAIANAVADAVGVRVTELPITAERVHRLLRSRGADATAPSGASRGEGKR
jgi:CO/xanthine dehydrogenase Mo-binding subunit